MVITDHGMNQQWQDSEGPLLQPRTTAPTTAPTMGARPRSYLTPAILSVCSGPWPLGVVAIYQAVQARSLANQAEAEVHSGKARSWTRATLVVAILLWWPAILAIVYNMNTGVYGPNDPSPIPIIVIFAVMLVIAGIGLILVAKHRVITTIVVCVLMLVIAWSGWTMYLT